MTCPLPKQDFCIRLTPHENGVRIRVSQDGVQLCDELAEDWAHAFRECIHAFVGGLKHAEHSMFTRHQSEAADLSSSDRHAVAATR